MTGTAIDTLLLVIPAGVVGKVIVKVGKGAKVGVKAAKSVVFSQKQLAKKFKHASDFGVNTTKKNPRTLAEFENAIADHLGDASTVQKGTYGFEKNSKVFYNPKTHNVVVLGETDNFITGFKLTPGDKQFKKFIDEDYL